MLNLARLLLLFLLSGILCSCAGNAAKYHLVRGFEPRESTLGFSVTPPPGDHWYETLKNKSLCYLKISKATAHSYSIFTQATEVELSDNIAGGEELLQYVRKEKKAVVLGPDAKKVREQYRIHQELDNCVRYEQVYEDYGLEGLAANKYVNVITTGLYCRHPENKNVAIDVSYLEKSVSGRQTPSFRSEGEEFLSSLSFNTTERL